MKIIRTFLFSIILIRLSVFFVYADDTLTLVLDPENPEPKSPVTITLQSYYFDIDISNITWKVNGTQVLQGVGEKKLTLKTGNVGEATKVSVLAKNADGSSIEQVLNLTPASITLLYEAPKSYVPLLYPGRSLPGEGALVHVTAFPSLSENGVVLSPSSLAYSWYVNDAVVSNVSGFGKQSADIHLDYLSAETDIRVIARSQLGTTAEKTITIQPHEVMPLMYLYDQILGTQFSQLIEKRFEAVKDFTLNLEPFYLSQEGTQQPEYNWFLDGFPSTPDGGRLLSLRPKPNSYGSKTLTISIKGPEAYLQSAESSLELIFDTRK